MKTRLAGLLALALLALAAPAFGLDPGPAVGAKIPAGFTAANKTGAPQSLASISGRNGVVLAFVRSAKWCPYCQKQLIDLKAAQAPLAAQGYRLAAISYDDPAVLAQFAAKQSIGYTLLSDKGSAMIDAFKLRDPQYKPDSFAYGVPTPAIFVIGRNGVIKAKLAEEGYKTRPPVPLILQTVSALPK